MRFKTEDLRAFYQQVNCSYIDRRRKPQGPAPVLLKRENENGGPCQAGKSSPAGISPEGAGFTQQVGSVDHDC